MPAGKDGGGGKEQYFSLLPQSMWTFGASVPGQHASWELNKDALSQLSASREGWANEMENRYLRLKEKWTLQRQALTWTLVLKNEIWVRKAAWKVEQ